MDLDFISIGLNLKQAREMNRISVAKACEYASISRSYIFRIENAERRVTVKKFYDLCELYKIDPEKAVSMKPREFKQYLRSLKNYDGI